MEKKLIVTIAQLTETQKQMIATAAEENGYSAFFYQNDIEAVPFVEDAEIIFASSPKLAGYSPRLRWFCASSAGVNNYLTPGVFASKDAVLTSSSGAYGVTISEHIIMVALEIMRRQQDYIDIVKRREWQRGLPIRSIRDCRISLLGTGDIGRETARRLRAFDPECIIGINRSGKAQDGLFDEIVPQEQMDEILKTTQLLILSLPATPETDHLLNEKRLALLPDDAIIVNVGRGSVIDQRALEAELRKGRLFAALDVFEEEPLDREDSLWDCRNLIITPHIAGNMTLPYTVDRIVKLFLENFKRYCAGQPLKRLIDFEKGY